MEREGVNEEKGERATDGEGYIESHNILPPASWTWATLIQTGYMSTRLGQNKLILKLAFVDGDEQSDRCYYSNHNTAYHHAKNTQTKSTFTGEKAYTSSKHVRLQLTSTCTCVCTGEFLPSSSRLWDASRPRYIPALLPRWRIRLLTASVPDLPPPSLPLVLKRLVSVYARGKGAEETARARAAREPTVRGGKRRRIYYLPPRTEEKCDHNECACANLYEAKCTAIIIIL